ncbi:MAG: octaprenyl diphosphate synthase [Deltaproteobacteria bacterium CG11_big_fil_rev_8_21_14_0_20_49_13]|nr:MAG: octaprenyl diphosphate synthase [Deltaproteobacteria bacterium CG11_big_fil_rev_8_21_14_0_20_49_13]
MGKVKDMSLATICLPVQAELKEAEELLIGQTGSSVQLVSQAAEYVLQNGGKRVRPAILLLTTKMLGGDVDAGVRLSVALELIHAASLMHDDVVDNAKLRRGKASSNVKWGNQISILVGDFLWCKASRIAIETGNMRIISSLTNAVEKTTEGEILEIVKSNDFFLDREEYLKIIELKTAMLFACAGGLGAISADSSEKMEESFKSFGLNLGVAFQLADDVLDYVSDEEKFGKKAGTDLCEGKLTLPIILALKKCGNKEAHVIKEALLSNTMDTQRLGEVKGILKSHGAIEASLSMARAYANRAKEELTSFKPSLEKEALMALADYSVSRNE